MDAKEIDPTITNEEEKFILPRLDNVSGFLSIAKSRDPEDTTRIIRSGKRICAETENFYDTIMEKIKNRELPSEFAGLVEQRMGVIMRAKQLPLFSFNENEINRENQPSVRTVACDSERIEMLCGNLYASVSLFNSLLYDLRHDGPASVIKSVNVMSEQFTRIVKEYEISRQQGDSCLRNRDHTGRAMFLYAYELLDSRRNNSPNILERIKRTGDVSLMYGEGVHLQIKDSRILSHEGRKTISRTLMNLYERKGTLSYSGPIRAIFLEVVPKYSIPGVV